ncbi:c-type cytochrome [Pseudothauera rhizosphaerae]|uniref:c-type cytochrome n=1 Tax=Pseudothauera rhizosphaerae TaxID=2565932 RepID=UPI001E3C2B55|nr:c-type cytochrome [Pseudothauera rhizosphaerae]
MRGIAESLSEQDMADLAAYYGTAQLPAQAAGDPAGAGETSAVCAVCHGVDGNSPTPEFPRIAGQHEDYLYQAVRAYQTGARKNPIMAAQVEKLSRRELRELAAWFASRQGLHVKR